MFAKAISIPKDPHLDFNEDAVYSSSNSIAISDGAGGGGLFAERWSQYLVNNLPDTPIQNFEDFNKWLDNIWEPFYTSCEENAKKLGGLALDKFYTEGSFATLSSVWYSAHKNKCYWISYGDSAVFRYNFKTKELTCSIGSLTQFNSPPNLINCKDEPKEDGFLKGEFNMSEDTIVFICSDALSHYMLLMYFVDNKEDYKYHLEGGCKSPTKNAVAIQTALSMNRKFDVVLRKMVSASKNKANFRRHLESLVKKHLLIPDDFSFAYCTSHELSTYNRISRGNTTN